MRFLDIRNNRITNLTGLPNGLVELRARNNQIRELVGLPDSIVNLDVVGNDIRIVDTELPNLHRLSIDVGV